MAYNLKNWVLHGCSSSSSSRSVNKKKTKKTLVAKIKKKKKKKKKEKRASCPFSVLDSPYFFPNRKNNLQEDEDYKLYGDDYPFKPPKEKYSDELNKVKLLKIVKGKPLEEGVYKLLSNTGKDKGESYLVRNNGEKVGLMEAIAGKYLIICCFYVHVLSVDRNAEKCRALIASYSELRDKRVSVEMVVVAKMRTALIAEDEEELAFNHFFSAFPSHCLVVPLSDSSSRELICKRLGLGTKKVGFNEDACLVLDPDYIALGVDSTCFVTYGAASFPFTKAHFSFLDDKHWQLKLRLDPIYKEGVLWSREYPFHDVRMADALSKPLGLNELLCCDEPLKKCDGSAEEVTVSELSKKKCVGLYLCYDGEFIDTLHELHRKCVEKELKFEIVLVSIRMDSDNPLSYSNALNLALQKNNITSWWVLRFSDEVSRRLYRLRLGKIRDGLIIWANGGTSGELDAIELIERFGSNAYPFNKKDLVDDRLSTLRSFTITSLLGVENSLSLVPGDSTSGNVKWVSDLENRDVLLYFASSLYFDPGFNNGLRNTYKQIKADYPDSEVVFVPMDQELSDNDLVANVPWPRLSFPIARPYPELLGRAEVLMIAFEADNQMKSICAIEKLDYKEMQVSLFDDTLREEILHDLRYED